MTSRLRIVAAFAAARWLRPMRSRAAILRRQRRLLRAQLRYLRRHSHAFRDAVSDDISQLPITDKQDMMVRFDEVNTVGARLEDAMTLALHNERMRDFASDLAGCSVGLSSGTSGHRGLFLVSPRERAAWAGTMLARTLPRGRILGHRIALFLRADNSLYESVASRAIEFAYFDVHDDLGDSLRRLEQYRPTILVAPPSVLLEIARSDAAAGGAIAPGKVYAVAEVLEEQDAARIASGLRQERIHQLYQCTEGFLAHTCEHGTIHLNEDDVLFEREALGDGRFTPVITDLRRRAQPIVRYRLGDVLRARQEPCPCGSALAPIERIEGRHGDTLSLRAVAGGTVPVFADLVSRAMVHAEGFAEFRVTQTGPAQLEIALRDASGDAPDSVRSTLSGLFGRMGCVMPELAFTPYRHDQAQKLRRVVRTWEGEHDASV